MYAQDNLSSIVFSAFFSICWPLFIVLTYLNPSGSGPLSMMKNPFTVLISSIAIASVSLLSYLLLFSCRRRTIFILSAAASFIFWTAAVSVMGGMVHRDFFSLFLIVIIFHVTVLMIKAEMLFANFRGSSSYSNILVYALIIYIPICVWIILMCYTIVIRTEPRWIESTFYNVYNGILINMILITALRMKLQSQDTLQVTEDSIMFNRRNISGKLSSLELGILQCFLSSPGMEANCAAIQNYLLFRNLIDREIPCNDICRENNLTPSKCKDYRNIKSNYIVHLNSKIELLGIGAIVPASENRKNIKNDGWKMRIFDSVRIIANSVPKIE